MKRCFSEGKLTKQFGNPPLSKRTPAFQLTPLFLSIFFHDPPLCPNFKNKKPPPNFMGGEETMFRQFKMTFFLKIMVAEKNIFSSNA